jgi:hypothetical protein
MTTTEAITALRNAAVERSANRNRKTLRAYREAASVVWAMFLANPTNDQLHEIVSVYSIEG